MFNKRSQWNLRADTMMPIKAVIFDFGGVLYRLPDHQWVKRWQRLLGLANDELITALLSNPEESQLFTDILAGAVAEEDVWQSFAQRWKLRQSLILRVRNAFMSKRRLNRPVAEFLGSLRGKYTTAILSNAGTDARRYFVETFEFDRIADLFIISAEEKMVKPDLRIYRLAAERIGIEPNEAVFVDDLLENVLAARQAGMRAVQYQDNSQVISEVRAILADRQK
jgi:putative hydrolase of the HAD superfamily